MCNARIENISSQTNIMKEQIATYLKQTYVMLATSILELKHSLVLVCRQRKKAGRKSYYWSSYDEQVMFDQESPQS